MTPIRPPGGPGRLSEEPPHFGAGSRSLEGVWGCSWALGLSTLDVRRAGTVCGGPRRVPWQPSKKCPKSREILIYAPISGSASRIYKVFNIYRPPLAFQVPHLKWNFSKCNHFHWVSLQIRGDQDLISTNPAGIGVKIITLREIGFLVRHLKC